VNVGCDIHFYVEKKVDGVWTLVYPEKLVEIRSDAEDSINCFSTPEKRAARQAMYDKFPGVWVESYEEYQKVVGSYEERWKHPLYIGRNYDLFAILADVRNGRGFAGVPTGGGFNPIADPKGIPEDASAGYRWEAERWDSDGHSHSYFTVRELLNYNWKQSTTHEGWVGPLNYLLYKEKGQPESWCGMVSGREIRHVSNEDMEKYISEKEIRLSEGPDKHEFGATIYTHVRWEVSYEACVDHFLETTLPALQQLGDPDEVRICFFFDN
jgi:hypothetical protein